MVGAWALAGAVAWSWAPLAARAPSAPITLSIVGTTDLHGRIFTEQTRGGLARFGGYLKNLRAARAADGGAVLLLDSGDTYQGGLDSNLSEGAVVIDAYNALGYTAAALGNHDFEFGPVDTWDGAPTPADRRGAIKARAAQARFPLLATNLREGDAPVAWPNVHTSVLVEAAGVKVGIVGVMTYDALSMTLAANVTGLRVTGLASTIAAEATTLRSRGAQVVVVASHAGGDCAAFDRPADLSTCDDSSEMFDVMRRLPPGLVDAVVAGHTHAGVAHEVNGVPIVQAYAFGRAFSRVDLQVTRDDAAAGAGARVHVTGARIFPPHDVCTWEDASGHCVDTAAAGAAPHYEGRAVTADPAVETAMAPALARVAALRATPLGAVLDGAVRRGTGAGESPLANLFADAFRTLAPGVDAAISYAAGPGGLRTDVPAGPATLGALYDVFPFDNLVLRRTLTGAELRQLLTTQMGRVRFGGRSLGVAGIRVTLSCRDGAYQADVVRASGQPIGDDERLVIAMSDFLAARAGALAPGAAVPHQDEPLMQMRDVVTTWFRAHGGSLSAAAFADPAQPRWTQPATCGPI